MHKNWYQAGGHAAQRLPAPEEIASLAAFHAESESLAPLMIWQVLHELAIVSAEGWIITEACKQAGIDAVFHRLLERWHLILEEEGIVEQRDHRWFAGDCAPALTSVEQRIDDGKIRLRRCLDWHSAGEAYLNQLFACHHSLCEVMRAPHRAHQLQSHNGEPIASLAVERRNIINDYFGEIVTSLLQTVMQGHDRPQVLEIGSVGLTADGSETDHVSVTPQCSQHAEPCFAHTSTLPTGHCDAHQPLDQKNPEQFHVVLAINSRRIASNLDVYLTCIWRLLKPGGALIVLEVTQDRALDWISAPAIQQAALGRHHQQDSSILSRECWQQAFLRTGFRMVGEWPEPDMPLAFVGQQIYIVQRPA
ncbi:hypothetical protein PRCB_23025 [Pantoea rodasii]|uniref:Uncharacterized protein n=1 Tax=Pantoea rodasii TaxID=1076549 RepID=A0A2M9W5Y1_9GAMM|nr:hypothetical protein [Pantoea rodasii]ORM65335.1 hypothetical protein HA45_05250 [Pantoea rodasii]PJZ02953.1 hypothetical protein PRCB_23025 [Pantoea rodasii]